jgi:integrase/recombinase XerD
MPDVPIPLVPPRLRKPWTTDLAPIVLEWFQDMRSLGLAKNTAVNYAMDLKDLAGFLLGPLEEATPENLREYRRTFELRNLSLSTCGRRIAAVRAFYDWLRKRQHLTASVAQDLKAPKRAERVHHFWTKAEVLRFRRVFTGDDPTIIRDRAVMELGLMGLRVSEVTSLDLHRIRELAVPTRASIIVRRKGNKEQYLPLTPEARRALRDWLAVRPPVETPAVFFRLPYQPTRPRLRYASLEKLLKRYAQQAGVTIPEGIAFHLLRHTAGQRMSDIGLGIEEAQRVLGHRSTRTTQVYYQVGDKRLRKAIRRLRY